MIDHFDFSREVVSVSISYLDRYLATRSVNKQVFQLAAMTSLFLAIKLFEPGRLSMQSMIELSRGYFTVKQMEAMELEILRYVSSLESLIVDRSSFVFLGMRFVGFCASGKFGSRNLAVPSRHSVSDGFMIPSYVSQNRY